MSHTMSTLGIHGLKMIAYFRSWLLSRADEYVLVRSVSDVIDAKRTQKLAVAFDIEGGVCD